MAPRISSLHPVGQQSDRSPASKQAGNTHLGLLLIPQQRLLLLLLRGHGPKHLTDAAAAAWLDSLLRSSILRACVCIRGGPGSQVRRWSTRSGPCIHGPIKQQLYMHRIGAVCDPLSLNHSALLHYLIATPRDCRSGNSAQRTGDVCSVDTTPRSYTRARCLFWFAYQDRCRRAIIESKS